MASVDDDKGSRRDFLYVATGAAGAVGVGAAVWPLVDQMNPSADVQALSSVQVDIADLEPGGQVTQLWLGKPVFIRRRTEDEIAAAADTPLDDLQDPIARNDNIGANDPADDANRTLAPFGGAENTGEWLVMVGVCTHLGCVPLGEAGDFNGWFCPCHGSHYDTAGRIRRGPAPTNLPVPVAEFVSETVIKLG
ncbi:MAG: ubiquinol-cytochrome c reductase iron-sulfur subunit [Pseudomonadota bacterium]